MMKECAERAFAALDGEKQTVYHTRFGEWYEARRRYLHAMTFYRRSGDYDALLRVVQEDAGILLASVAPDAVLKTLAQCPVSTLKRHPAALLVLMRSMFNWRNIPKMMELKGILLAAIGEHPEMPEEERGDLLGECDLIMSFLCYNDISAMSRLHRSASAQMSHQAISIRNSGGWTFGSPSVLMMFYRAPGELVSELAEMDECMPHYYRITDGHGQGAETIMRAEALFCRGRFTDAHIELERAYAQIRGNGQENMALCCDFLAWRLSLCAEVEPELTLEERREALLRQALSDGEPDGLVMPFVENYDGLAPLLAQEIRSDLIDRIVEPGEASRQRKMRNVRPRALSALTEREFEIVRLMAQRLSNREIAERLFLTEGSVKQYVKQIYSKLHIDGDTRTKRRRLNELLEAKA